MSRSLPVFALPLLAASLSAQTARPPQPEDFGTVTGHVICSDTQHPARLAEVRLVPVASPEAAGGEHGALVGEDRDALGSGIAPIQTDLSGAFTIRRVKPGQYYLRVDYAGYITPLLSFTRDQLARPDVALRQSMDRELQLMSVVPHAPTQVEATIVRGAAISGTVTYDDGSPAIGVGIRLFRRNAKGEFKEEYRPDRLTQGTDDHGRFHGDALPPGDYIVEAQLSMSESTLSTMPLPNGGEGTMQFLMQKVLLSLPVYSGTVFRRRDAALVEAAAGQDISNIDISVPLSRLHCVSGSLLAQDGHSINSGEVKLLHADDREEFTDVGVGREDKQFHFPYVPDDDYILSAPAAKDVTEVEVENAKGVKPHTHMEDKTVRTYGAAEHPLKVETDVTGVVVNVPDKKSDAPAAAAGSEPGA